MRRSYLLSNISYLLSIICGRRRARSGFTLIELLVVVAIISILATLVTGAAQRAMGLARHRRAVVSAQVLETALLRFRTDYNQWPDDLKHGNGGDSGKFTYAGEDNHYALSPLRYGSDENNLNIRYIDETAFLAPKGDSGFMKLSDADKSAPFVYKSRSGKRHYFTVVINAEDDIASVGGVVDD